MDITAVIISREGKIQGKLKKSLGFCKEVLVIKGGNITDFAKIRNEALKKAKGDWVLFVDDDETVSAKLANEIKKAVKDKNVNGYYIRRKDFIFGRELTHGEFSGWGRFGNTKLLRLAKRGRGEWRRSVHEYWDVKGDLGSLTNPLLHYPHRDLSMFISHINQFSTLHGLALKKEKKYSNIFRIIFWPPGKFVYNYIFRLGFLDGMEGFVAALVMSFHSFLAWSKLYIWQKNSH